MWNLIEYIRLITEEYFLVLSMQKTQLQSRQESLPAPALSLSIKNNLFLVEHIARHDTKALSYIHCACAE